jgi:hypothetical protein
MKGQMPRLNSGLCETGCTENGPPEIGTKWKGGPDPWGDGPGLAH